jgi:hypothetical protein
MLRRNNHACVGWQGASGFNPLALHHLKARVPLNGDGPDFSHQRICSSAAISIGLARCASEARLAGAADSSWQNVLKAQIYVPSAADIPDALDVWQQHVKAPARSLPCRPKASASSTASSALLFKTEDNIATPCSVNA